MADDNVTNVPNSESDMAVVTKLHFHFNRLRAEIDHEANMIVQRTSWFVSSQAFLLASTALGIDKSKSGAFTIENSIYYPVIPIVAMVISLLTIIAISVAVRRANQHVKKIFDFVHNNPEFKDIWIYTDGLPSFLGLANTQWLPYVFLIAWFFILDLSSKITIVI